MNISESIRHLALRGCEMYLSVCTVDAVNVEARTVDCTPIDEGAQLLGVNLQANQSEKVGIVALPAIGSEVVVGFINPAVAVVVLTMEVTKTLLTIGDTEIMVANNAVSLATKKAKVEIDGDGLFFDANGTTLEMNGDKSVWNGGSETTANATDLKKQLTLMSGRIDKIINALTSSGVVANDGGATYKSNIKLALSELDKEDFSGMIDDKIKH